MTPVTSNLEAISCVATTSTCVAVGQGGTAITTTNGGGTWTVRSSGTLSDLGIVRCLSATTCIAGGSNGTILKTTTTGAAWTTSLAGPGGPVMGLSCGSASICLAISNGMTLSSVDAGSTWKIISTAPQAQVMGPDALSCISALKCIETSGNWGSIEQTTDGGKTWAFVYSFAVGGAVWCGTTGRCATVVGSGPWAGYSPDGGSTWRLGSIITSGFQYYSFSYYPTPDLTCVGTFCVAVGLDNFGHPTSLSSGDGGMTWTTLSHL